MHDGPVELRAGGLEGRGELVVGQTAAARAKELHLWQLGEREEGSARERALVDRLPPEGHCPAQGDEGLGAELGAPEGQRLVARAVAPGRPAPALPRRRTGAPGGAST